MKKILIGTAYGLGIVFVGILVVIFYQSSRDNIVSTTVVASTTQDVTVDEDAITLAKISSNCAKYYDTVAQGPDPMTMELSDFTNLHPLSDFLCGDYSEIQPKAKLPDGKILHFVAPVFRLDCGGSGHCSYYPLLEEKPGMVRHIRGFTYYDDSGTLSQDTDGTIFAWEISYDSSKKTLLVDDTHLGGCGMQNTYKFNQQDQPTLILATNHDCTSNSTTTLFKL